MSMINQQRHLPGAVVVLYLLIVMAVAMGVVNTASAQPYIPNDEAVVLETLPLDLQASDELLTLQKKVNLNPTNSHRVVALVERYIQLGREESDPRYFSYAKAVLQPWWQSDTPPVEILLLRATLQQHDHNYQAANKDLHQLLRRQPGNTQGWLTLATIQMVQADYQGARASCSELARTGNSWVASVCMAQVMGLSGKADRGIQIFEILQQQLSSSEPALLQWVVSLNAELNAQTGKIERSEALYKQALMIPIRDPYILKTYAELLLQTNRHREVLDLLQNESRDDALLLQLARAATVSGRTQLSERYQVQLDLRYEEANLRGSTLHRREEALYLLEIKKDATRAHSLALDNWNVQKEPADTQILLQTSIAVNDIATINSIKSFIQSTGLEDSRIQKLLAMASSKGDA